MTDLDRICELAEKGEDYIRQMLRVLAEEVANVGYISDEKEIEFAKDWAYRYGTCKQALSIIRELNSIGQL